MSGIYSKKAKAIPTIACKNAPVLYIIFAPILAPYAPNIGEQINAAKLVIPNTNPY